MIENYTSYFKKDFSFEPQKKQFCFIDNNIDSDPDATEYEREMFDSAISKIKLFTKGNKPFFCQDIKAVLSERDTLLKKIKENEERSQKERAEYIAAE